MIDLVFSIREIHKSKNEDSINALLWPMSRTTAYRLIKRVMKDANISGKMATAKGLRHGFGVAMATAKKPLPLHLLSKALGHSNSKTTEVYLSLIGAEERKLVLDAWAD
jgi:integrase